MAGGQGSAPGPGEFDDGNTQEAEDAFDEGLLEGDGESENEDGGDHDAGTDGGPDGQDLDPQAQARNVGRGGGGSRQFRELRARAQRAEEALAASDRRFAELEARIGQRQPSAADLAREQAEEQARVELMTPAQVAQYYAEKTRRDVTTALQASQFQTNDLIDRQSFEAMAASDPLLRRVADQVERTLASERAAGRSTNRLIIADFHLGRMMREAAAAKRAKAQGGGQRRINRQTTRPLNGAGDTPRAGGRQGDDSYEAAVRRTRGVPL